MFYDKWCEARMIGTNGDLKFREISTTGGTMAWRNLAGSRVTVKGGHIRCAEEIRTPGVYMTCMVSYGSGVPIRLVEIF